MFGGARILPTAGMAKNVEFCVCLSVCRFLRHTHLNAVGIRQVAAVVRREFFLI